MRRITVTILSFCLLLSFAGCGRNSGISSVSAPEQAGQSSESSSQDEAISHAGHIDQETMDARLEDLDFLYKTLSIKHKNLFFKTTREEYDRAKSALEDKLSTLTDVECYHALEEFVALAGDGHTRISLDQNQILKYSFQTGLPFAVSKFGEAWHLRIANEDNMQYLGFKVTAIDGVPIDEVYRKASVLVSHDTDAWMSGQFSNTINFIDTLHYLGITESMESVTLTLLDGETTVDAVFPAMSEEEIMRAPLPRLEVPMPETYPDGSIYRAFDLSPQILFIQYNACMEDPEYPISKFISDVEDTLTEGAYEKVIVDLRYNSGGNSSLWDPMTKMLKAKKEDVDFSLYCLIGTDTFSSGIINAVDMKEIGAELMGMPTGGAVNHYGEVKTGTLPNAPFIFSYSVKYFEMISGYEQDSLYPDTVLEPTFQGYMDGIDEAVQPILSA